MPRKTSFAWGVANLVILLAAVIAGYFIVVYRQNIQDWWALSNYNPPAAIKQLADETTMVGYGRDMFFVSKPEVQGSAQFNQNCTDHGEKSLVLGCYKAQRIYLYQVTDSRLAGVIQVTAAHEMLHAVYERLSEPERTKVNSLLEAQLTKIKDERLNALIKLYDQHEPDQRLNELHSILATEYADLSPDLNQYYSQYFTNRAKVVAYAASYANVFTASQNKIAELAMQLDGLKKQIDANSAELNRQQTSLEDDAAELNSLRDRDPVAYNEQVPVYNAQVRTYNALVVATRSLVEKYNALVVAHNNEAAAQSDLYHSLDSHYQTVGN